MSELQAGGVISTQLHRAAPHLFQKVAIPGVCVAYARVPEDASRKRIPSFGAKD
jgi:hypothetical protein